MFFFSCSVSRGFSLSWALLEPACLDDEAVGVDEERSLRSSVVLIIPGPGEHEVSEELEARDAGGCADGMMVVVVVVVVVK